MHSRLSTLQPDQYRFMTWAPERSVIVCGGPGTGKTVVGAHRVAWLTASSSDTERDPVSNVAFLGPSGDWTVHVRRAIAELRVDPAQRVEALPELFTQLAGSDVPPALTHNNPISSSWSLYRVAQRCSRFMGYNGSVARTAAGDRAMIVRNLRDSQRMRESVANGDPDLRYWLDQLPPEHATITDGEYTLFRAALGVVLGVTKRRFGHIIVDEAQELRPLEWCILDRLRTDGATWTLLGDLNQRDVGDLADGWREIAINLDFGIDDTAPNHLQIAYRSTSSILDFAAPLLVGSSDRVQQHTIIDGGPVVAKRAKPAGLSLSAIEEATDLARRHADTSVAIITTDVSPIRRELQIAGWRQRPEKQHWFLNDLDLWLHDAFLVSGLEFEAAVVVEPAAFPSGVGFHGVLYTALTRAAKELVVVHSKPLPHGLRIKKSPATKPS